MSAPYPNAVVYLHPSLTAAQAVQVARDNGLRLIQTGRGNFYLTSAAQEPVTAMPGPHLHSGSPPASAAGYRPGAA